MLNLVVPLAASFLGLFRIHWPRTSKMSMAGWWMVQAMVRSVLTIFRTTRITIAAALASSPAVCTQAVNGCQLLHERRNAGEFLVDPVQDCLSTACEQNNRCAAAPAEHAGTRPSVGGSREPQQLQQPHRRWARP